MLLEGALRLLFQCFQPMGLRCLYRVLTVRHNIVFKKLPFGIECVRFYQSFGFLDNQLESEVTDFYEETKVKFAELSEELLWEYIHSGEPM